MDTVSEITRTDQIVGVVIELPAGRVRRDPDSSMPERTVNALASWEREFSAALMSSYDRHTDEERLAEDELLGHLGTCRKALEGVSA